MTPKCRILCPTFGGHITFHKLRLLLFNQRWEPSYWQHPLCLYYTPFPGLCQSLPAGAAGQFCKKPQGAIAAHRAEFGLSIALSGPSAGYPSGGPFLVPPRKGERMRLKEALKGLLPQTKPSSLRILPARTWYREARFRHFLRKHPPHSTHSMPVCALARNRRPLWLLKTIASGNRTLSRILAELLGGTRKGPPEGHPAQIFDRAFDKHRPAGVWQKSTGLPGLYRRGLKAGHPGGTPEGTRDTIEQIPSSRNLAAVHRTGRAVPQGAFLSSTSLMGCV